MNKELTIILKTIISKNSLSYIQKQLSKQKFNINLDIPSNNLSTSVSKIENQTYIIEKSIKKLLNNSDIQKQTEQWAIQFNQILSIVNQISEKIGNSEDSANDFNISFEDTITNFESILMESKELSDIFSTAISYIGKMTDNIYEIDTAMTNLYRNTHETNTKYKEFLSSTNQSAQELGSTVTTLIDRTVKWAEQGYNLDDSSVLTKASSIYSNISGVDDSTAISHISSAMEAFNIEATDSITIIDKLSKLENEFSSSSSDIGTGLSIAASDLQSAGNDINQTLAMITGSSELIQDTSATSNSLKIFSMRIRGMKDELKQLGEDDINVLSSFGMRNRISELTGGSVDIFDSSGNLKSSYKILNDIANIYIRLSKTEQTDLLQTLFGSQRMKQGSSIIKAFQSGEIEKAYLASVNAVGSAYNEQSKWMETLDAKTRQFEASFQSLSQSIVNSNILKWFIDFGIVAINAVDSVAKIIGSLPAIMLGTGAIIGAKNFGRLKVSLNIHCVLFRICPPYPRILFQGQGCTSLVNW